MSSRFSHVVTNSRVALFFKAEQYLKPCIYHIFFILLFVDRPLGYFYVLGIVINVAMKRGVQISLQDFDFNYFGHIPRNEIAEP